MFCHIICQIPPPRVSNKIKNVATVCGHVTIGSAYPLLWFAWVVFCDLLVPLRWCFPSELRWAAVGVPFRPIFVEGMLLLTHSGRVLRFLLPPPMPLHFVLLSRLLILPHCLVDQVHCSKGKNVLPRSFLPFSHSHIPRRYELPGSFCLRCTL